MAANSPIGSKLPSWAGAGVDAGVDADGDVDGDVDVADRTTVTFGALEVAAGLITASGRISDASRSTWIAVRTKEHV